MIDERSDTGSTNAEERVHLFREKVVEYNDIELKLKGLRKIVREKVQIDRARIRKVELEFNTKKKNLKKQLELQLKDDKDNIEKMKLAINNKVNEEEEKITFLKERQVEIKRFLGTFMRKNEVETCELKNEGVELEYKNTEKVIRPTQKSLREKLEEFFSEEDGSQEDWFKLTAIQKATSIYNYITTDYVHKFKLKRLKK